MPFSQRSYTGLADLLPIRSEARTGAWDTGAYVQIVHAFGLDLVSIVEIGSSSLILSPKLMATSPLLLLV